ncbi:hypothetical protein Gotri_001067 [Gossypium trilobum]|uniref:Pentatricopeptide repeat-containing protein n=1 Tax=Gossypium trilobum TaxID=34281 RepID=A0A7J9FDL5_9ROSI|nr:hypothetical protein [Gossypium trilobum]
MISGYSQNGYSKKAQSLFKTLTHQCLQLSFSTDLAIILSCISPDSRHFGKSINYLEIKAGLSSNILMVNSLMHMYINFGDLSAALMLFDTIFAEEDIACWNTIIVGCTNNGHFREALATFNWMRQVMDVMCNSITLVNVISASRNLLLIYEGKSLHGLAIKTFVGSETGVYKNLLQETTHRAGLNPRVYTTV